MILQIHELTCLVRGILQARATRCDCSHKGVDNTCVVVHLRCWRRYTVSVNVTLPYGDVRPTQHTNGDCAATRLTTLLALQRIFYCCFGMKSCGIEQRHPAGILLDEQADFGAAENDCFRIGTY